MTDSPTHLDTDCQTPSDASSSDLPETKEKKSRFSWIKSGIDSINEKASDLKKSAEEKYKNIDQKYKPDYVFDKCKPYIEKAILMVAIAAASETLSDEEKMESIYFWILKLVPSPIRLFLPEKLIFKMLWSARDDLIIKVDKYKEQINASEDREKEIKYLTDNSDNIIKENTATLEKDLELLHDNKS